MCHIGRQKSEAKIAQLGERMTEDHKVRCSIHLLGAFFFGRWESRIIGKVLQKTQGEWRMIGRRIVVVNRLALEHRI